jgi:hypothetical protein
MANVLCLYRACFSTSVFNSLLLPARSLILPVLDEIIRNRKSQSAAQVIQVMSLKRALLSAFLGGICILQSVTVHAQSLEFDIEKINREAGAPPVIEPPNDQCTCEWTDWISSDSPKKNDDDSKYCILVLLTFQNNSLISFYRFSCW